MRRPGPRAGLEGLLRAAVVQEVRCHIPLDRAEIAAGDDLQMLNCDPSCLEGINRSRVGRPLRPFRVRVGVRPDHGSVIVPEVLMIATPPATFTVPDPLPDAPANGPVPPRIVCVISWNCGFPVNPKPM